MRPSGPRFMGGVSQGVPAHHRRLFCVSPDIHGLKSGNVQCLQLRIVDARSNIQTCSIPFVAIQLLDWEEVSSEHVICTSIKTVKVGASSEVSFPGATCDL
jgi:hypothetical protein